MRPVDDAPLHRGIAASDQCRRETAGHGRLPDTDRTDEQIGVDGLAQVATQQIQHGVVSDHIGEDVSHVSSIRLHTSANTSSGGLEASTTWNLSGSSAASVSKVDDTAA